MKDALNFIKGAVSSKDFVPALKHVHIANGRIQSFNGSLALSSPIDFDKTICPKGKEFIRAIDSCTEPQISITKAGRLKVQDGSFKVFIDSEDEKSFPVVEPEGEIFDCVTDLTLMLKSLLPFTGTDASKPWAMGVLIRQGYAYATNNVMLACFKNPLGISKNLIIPKPAIDELLRIKQPVRRIQTTDNAIVFHFDDERWLRSNLVADNGPDFLPIFQKFDFTPTALSKIPDDLSERILKLKPFTDKKNPLLIFRQDGIFTALGEAGASDSEYPFPLSVFRIEAVEKVLEVATCWNLSTYPAPCPFMGDNVTGVMIGTRLVGLENEI